MTASPQAVELMALAKDANTPMQIEVPSMETWANCTYREALQAIAMGVHRVRIKPSTLMIGDIEVEGPMREVPKVGEAYWVVSLTSTSGIIKNHWDGDISELRCLRRGLLHSTEQKAKDTAEAILNQFSTSL